MTNKSIESFIMICTCGKTEFGDAVSLGKKASYHIQNLPSGHHITITNRPIGVA